jgi:hypothetical protein
MPVFVAFQRERAHRLQVWCGWFNLPQTCHSSVTHLPQTCHKLAIVASAQAAQMLAALHSLVSTEARSFEAMFAECGGRFESELTRGKALTGGRWSKRVVLRFSE